MPVNRVRVREVSQTCCGIPTAVNNKIPTTALFVLTGRGSIPRWTGNALPGPHVSTPYLGGLRTTSLRYQTKPQVIGDGSPAQDPGLETGSATGCCRDSAGSVPPGFAKRRVDIQPDPCPPGHHAGPRHHGVSAYGSAPFVRMHFVLPGRSVPTPTLTIRQGFGSR